MSELAVSHLRQAVRLAQEGNHVRAVELLEKARILVRDDATLRTQVLDLLAREYAAAGRPEQAAKCREQLAAMPGRAAPLPPPAAPVPVAPSAPRPAMRTPPALPQASFQPAAVRRNPFLLYVLPAVGLLIVGLIIAAGIFLYRKSRPTALTSARPTPAATTHPATVVPVAAPPPSSVIPTATPPAPSVVKTPPPVVAVVKGPPSLTRPPVPVVSPVKVDRQELLKDTVGLCVVVARYEGPVGEKDFRVELPVGTGTAFCVNPDGVMLTNRHVVEAAKEAKLPDTLDDDHLPFVTLREVSYIVCFGPDAKDRYPARVLHTSTNFDMAVLKIDRKCDHPLAFATKVLRQGDDVLVCGYPGAVMEALNQSSNTPARITAMTRKWETTRHVEPFDDFSPDSFYSTLTRGIVSAPDRHMDGVSYIQIDAAISPGNSGGPTLNLDNEVLGIATLQLRPPAEGAVGANYNFALGISQLVSELKPYLKD